MLDKIAFSCKHTEDRYPYHTENNHFIWNANQLIGFYNMKTITGKSGEKNVKHKQTKRQSA